jgi:2-C-methyl-D-erythritol 4-phosphate cytidylyltransferase/2-C-methyl-D-erythritol 2,4-cyclodiphosphate synthase
MENSARNKASRPFHLLIAAAGTGTRTGLDLPKQYAEIGGKAILRHTVDAFYAIDGLQSITVVIAPDAAGMCHDALNDLLGVNFVDGGDCRKSSVYNCLMSLSNVKDDEVILIHDAARPFVHSCEISALLKVFDKYDAATLACPVSDTIRRGMDQPNILGDIIERDGLWAIQTPQAFRYGLICKAHKNADPAQSYTDDTALVSALGTDVAIVPAGRQNFKITDAADIEIAQMMIEGRQAMQTHIRTGTGFDVHAFVSKTADRPLMLCGVDVPHDKALGGHSDADVGLHALTDALLGAIGAGDIGDHFPPSDPQWKDKDSAHFLAHAVQMLVSAGGSIHNLDVTLICEEPKLSAHKQAMKARVAGICNVSEEQVNIKATTTEQLGFTGRKEGIAAQAVATVSFPCETTALKAKADHA